MHADIKGALDQIDRRGFILCFEHKGQRMSKKQIRAVLQYADRKGYETTRQLTDDEVDEVIAKLQS